MCDGFADPFLRMTLARAKVCKPLRTPDGQRPCAPAVRNHDSMASFLGGQGARPNRAPCWRDLMKRTRSLLVGSALALLSVAAVAAPKTNTPATQQPSATPSATQQPSTAKQGTTTTTTTTTPTQKDPTTTGQPNVECGDPGATSTPGGSASAPGSAFNENGTAGTKYAGEQPQNSKNTASKSQYDTACANQPH